MPGVTRKSLDFLRSVKFLLHRFRNNAPGGYGHEQKLNMTLREWVEYHQHEVVMDQCSWMGKKTLKNPLDTWIYQEILFEIKPDFLIEIGSYAGGSTLFFAHLFDIIGHGRVISIEMDRSRYDVAHDRIIEITGDCSAPDTLSRVEEVCSGGKAIVIHDGDHARESVLRDLTRYARFVTPGSYMIVEDGIVDLMPPGEKFGWLRQGPLSGVEAFLAENTDFEVDRSRERYLLTYNPGGFLKRVR